MNPPFHLIQQVIHKIKQDKTQAVLVVPFWDDKPWFQELQDICVDYMELQRKIKLYARDDTGPLRQRSWSWLAFLVDGGLPDSDSADSGTDSCVGSESEVERGTDDECIVSDFSPSDGKADLSSNGSALSPSSPIRSTSKRIFSTRAKKNFKSRRKLRVFFTKNVVWKLSMILSRSWITKMISGMPALDPPTFKRQLIRTFYETSVRRFFLLRRRRLPQFFGQ